MNWKRKCQNTRASCEVTYLHFHFFKTIVEYFHLNPRTRHGHVLSELFQLVILRLILLVNEQIAQIVKANRIFIYHLY